MISYESKIRAQCVGQYGDELGNEFFDLAMESSKILLQLETGMMLLVTPKFLRQHSSPTGLHALDLAKTVTVMAKGNPQI